MNFILIVVLSVICSILAFAIVYGIVKNKVSKYAMIVVVYIELCVIAAIFFKNPIYFAFLGILSILPILKNLMKRK